MSCSEICCLLGGAWFQCRYEGFWMSSCWLMFPEVRSLLVFYCFGFKPPASGFSHVLTVASRLLYPYSTNEKTSRLMMKSFFTVRGTQRGWKSYMGKRRGRWEIEVTRSRGGESKGERASKPLITLLSKNGTEDWILKGTELIINTKKQRLKI